MTRNCVICNREFVPNSSKQKTCSLVCSRRNRNQVRVAYRRLHGPKPTRHMEYVANDPDPERRAARVAYLKRYYANDKAKVGIHRNQ